MALLDIAVAARAGADITGVVPTASTGDTFASTGAELVVVNNASASPINVTAHIPTTIDGAAPTADPVHSVGAHSTSIFGPYPPGIYNDPTTGLTKLTCSAVTNVTVAVAKAGSA
jgi:hypothetical protein